MEYLSDMGISVQWGFWRMGRPVTGQVPISVSFLTTFASVLFFHFWEHILSYQGKKISKKFRQFIFFLANRSEPSLTVCRENIYIFLKKVKK